MWEPERRRARWGRRVVVVVVLAAVPLLVAVSLRDLPPPVGVRVQGTVHYLPQGTTFGSVIDRFHLQAIPGSFLDVEGKVLRPDVYPGRIVLDGNEAPPATVLSDGDTVEVQDGPTRTEGIRKLVTQVPPQVPSNPQFYLGTAPGVQVVKEGRVSGKLVSSTFKPTGPTQTPKAVALTFDDGPSALYTLRILKILKHFHVQATFFTVGYWVSAHPELVRAEAAAGMVVGDHTYSHPNSPPFRDLPVSRIRSEMARAATVLGQAGVTPYLFRPPGGTYSDQVVNTANSLGMRVVLWSVDPQDWRSDVTAPQIVHTVLAHAHRGSIVILHDGGGYQDATVKALPKIIRGIRKKGLQLVGIGR